MGEMAVGTFRHAVVPPFVWGRSFVSEVSLTIRRCLAPLILAETAFVLGAGVVLGGTLVEILGTTDRYTGTIGLLAGVREVSVWISTMVIAGVAGSAMCADLGARKVREEIDALNVLGVSTMKSLVVPRVLAMTFGTMLAGLIGYLVWFGGNQIASVLILGQPAAAGFTTGKALLYTPDTLAFVVKMALIGFLIGVVACQKGLNASGGPEGVGRAVAQTVLITYVGIWLLNVAFNLFYLSVFPQTQVLR